MPDLYFRNDGAVLVKNKHSHFIMAHVHDADSCEAPCVIHTPSDHHMRDWDLAFFNSTLDRVCPHGYGHPDPDSVEFARKHHPEQTFEPHTHCDGCCIKP